jgi:hypothetical protein
MMIDHVDRTSRRSRRAASPWLVRLFAIGILGLVAGSVFGTNPATPAAAQDERASPVPTVDLATELGMNAGVGLDPLAQGVTTELPATPALLRLERITVPPGTQIPMHEAVGPELLSIESGKVVAIDSFGFRASLPALSQVLFNDGFGYSLSNATKSEATLIRLTVLPIAAADTSGTPTPESATAGDTAAASVVLFESEVDQLPSSPATLFLGRMSWDPGAATGRYWQEGWFGILLEAGQITLRSPSGLEIPLVRNRAQLIPSRVTHEEVNPGTNEAVALVLAVVDARGALTHIGDLPTDGTPTGQ